MTRTEKKTQNLALTFIAAASCLVAANFALADDSSTGGSAGTAGTTDTSANPTANPGNDTSATGGSYQGDKPVVDKSAAAKSPKDICQNLVDAAKKDDLRAFQTWTTSGMHMSGTVGKSDIGKSDSEMPGKAMKGMEKGMDMHGGSVRNDLNQLKDISCGTEHMGGLHAIVEADKGGEKRFLPFVQENGLWKFDTRSFHSIYRESLPSTG